MAVSRVKETMSLQLPFEQHEWAVKC